MIITITCNPAIDKSLNENSITYDVGGKGINVSKLLKNLGVDSIATGFIGRNNKDVVLDKLDELGIEHHFIEVDGDVRTNTKRIINNQLFEENQRGPIINDSDKDKLIDYLKQFDNEIVVLSGSCTSNIYYDLVKVLKNNNNYVILDCDNQLLVDGIMASPNVIKPNKDEICKYFHCDYDENRIIEKTKCLGLDLVCISLGNEGSLFIYKDDVYKAQAMEIDYKNATGAGDSMVGAIAFSMLNNLDIMETIKLAVASASAACEVQGSSAPDKESIFEKKERVEVYKL